MVRGELILAGVFASVLVAGPAAAADNVIHLVATGCNRCLVSASGANPMNERDWVDKTVQLRAGRADLVLPARFESLLLTIQTKKGWSGKGGAAVIVPQYRYYLVGESVPEESTRGRKGAKYCTANDSPEWTLRFTVLRDPGDPRPRPNKKKDPAGHAYWTPFVLRAWADPTVQGLGSWNRVWGGQAEVQNTTCGLGTQW